jgi:hypothetical protein
MSKLDRQIARSAADRREQRIQELRAIALNHLAGGAGEQDAAATDSSSTVETFAKRILEDSLGINSTQTSEGER